MKTSNKLETKKNVRNDRFNRPFRASEWGCDDFATVDVREELCKTTPPKKQIRRATLIGQSFRKNRGQKIIRTATCRLGSYYSCLVPVERTRRAPPFGTRKSSCAAHCLFFFCPPILRFVRRGVGKRGRTRTDTDFTPQDFESSASASFTTPAQITIYHSAGELTSVFATARNVLQDVSCGRREGRMLRGERGAGRVAENFKKMCGLAYANLLTNGERAAYNSGVKSE